MIKDQGSWLDEAHFYSATDSDSENNSEVYSVKSVSSVDGMSP